jgi:hypothetical protein
VTAVNAALDAGGYRGPRIATGNRDRLHEEPARSFASIAGGIGPRLQMPTASTT